MFTFKTDNDIGAHRSYCDLSLFLQAQVHEAKEVATLVGVDAYVRSRFESRLLHTQIFAGIWHIELR